MNSVIQGRSCPACGGAALAESTRERQFHPAKKTVTVILRVSQCPSCNFELINSEQRRENLQRLRERKSEYGPLLLGEEIVALRKRYGLTQKAAAKIFGKGLIAFSRYENEVTYPDATTTKLLKRAIASPEVLKALADEEGVEIPLWETRLEDAKLEKLIELMLTNESHDHGAVWRQASIGALTPVTSALKTIGGAFKDGVERARSMISLEQEPDVVMIAA